MILEYAFVVLVYISPIAVTSTIVYGPVYFISIFALCDPLHMFYFGTLSPAEKGLLKVLVL